MILAKKLFFAKFEVFQGVLELEAYGSVLPDNKHKQSRKVERCFGHVWYYKSELYMYEKKIENKKKKEKKRGEGGKKSKQS